MSAAADKLLDHLIARYWKRSLTWAELLDAWQGPAAEAPARPADQAAASPLDRALAVLAQHGEQYRQAGEYWVLIGTETMRRPVELIARAEKKRRAAA